MTYNFPEMDDHMFVERERSLFEADEHDAMLAAVAEEEEARQEGLEAEGTILSEEEAEKLINDYIRSDWSGHRMDQIPW